MINGGDIGLPNQSGVTSTDLDTAINFIISLAGVLSVLFIVIGAVRLSVSGGDPQNVATARRTIIYSVVGLVVSVLSIAITSITGSIGRSAAGQEGNPLFGVDGVLTSVIEWLTAIVGVASVIMIIIGAIRYITSGGQPQSAESARNTIIYAIIGLVVSLIAQAIVVLVLNRI